MASSKKSPCSEPLRAGWLACAEGRIRHGQKVTVGLSGGLDSASLLHWLSNGNVEDKVHLSALHVHHGISENADAWADGCRSLCEQLQVPLAIVRVTVERGSSDGLEGAARRARHAAYAQAKSDWILLGHHRADQAETLLFNLLRGCGVRGAGGMRPQNHRLLRPWLGVGRDVIERYAREAGLRWVEDDSNTDIRFSRNFLRHHVIPLLQERFPAAEARLATAAMRFAEAQELLEELARIDLGRVETAFPVPVAVLTNLSESRARNLLAYLLRANGVPVASGDRLAEALRQLLTAASDRHPAITFDRHQLTRRRGMIELNLLPGLDPAAAYNKRDGGTP